MNDLKTKESRTQKFTGLIIKTALFGEGHRLITLIEKDRARVEITAFGAGKEKSSRRAALMVSHIVECVVQRSRRGDGWILSEIEVLKGFPGLTRNYSRMGWFYLIIEILDLCLEQDSGFFLFDALYEVLSSLETCDNPAVYAFLLLFRFLRQEGVFPLHTDLVSGLREMAENRLQAGKGTLRFLADTEVHPEISYWHQKRLSDEVIKELLDLLVITVKYHYRRELSSLDLIRVNDL